MPGPRELARTATITNIKTEARRQLARDGAAGLSLRSVARELGMVSSAVYRYVESRDELLTLLIVECYDELATAVESAARGHEGREAWARGWASVRSWALRHRCEYALLYGSPVPGYAAPEDTTVSATRAYAALLAPLRSARRPRRRRTDVPLPEAVAEDARRVVAGLELGDHLDERTVIAALGAVAAIFGLVSFELFGHTNNVVTDHEAFFALQIESFAAEVGL